MNVLGTKNKNNVEQHLGGHQGITHIDEGLISWITETYQPKNVLDIGCGPGGNVELLNSRGIKTVGVDGDYTLKRNNPENYILVDFTKDTVDTGKYWDWGYSCEFVEHVEEKYLDNFMKVFQQCKYVTITHALPGDRGHHHVNCKDDAYWIDVFGRYGFKHDYKLTNMLRSRSTMNLDKKRKQQFFKRTGLFFTNTK